MRAVAAYLARYRGQTRVHTESDLRSFLVWCRERGVDPLGASRAQVELYVRWMQEVRHFQPSTGYCAQVEPVFRCVVSQCSGGW